MSVTEAAPAPDDAHLAEAQDRRPVRDLVILLAVTVLFTLLLWTFFVADRLVDDAYIYLSFAKNLALNGQWAMVEGVPSNSATSTMIVLLLGAITVVVRNPIVAEAILYIGCSTATAWALWKLASILRAPKWVPWVTVGLLLVNPLLISSVGLETPISLALIPWLLVAVVTKRPIVAGLLAGLMFLTRPDLLIIAIVILLVQRFSIRKLVTVALVALLTVLPWLLFSWFELGSFIPDTLVIKQGSSWGNWVYANGLALWIFRFPGPMFQALIPVAAGVFAWIGLLAGRKRLEAKGIETRPLIAIGAAGLLYYIAYCILNVPPFHWYYGVPFATLIIVFGFAAGQFQRLIEESGTRSWILPAVTVIPVLTAFLAVSQVTSKQTDPLAVLSSNWATPGQYETMSAPLGETVEGQPVKSPGEIGTLAYFCNCTIVDEFSDSALVNQVVQERLQQSSGLKKALLKLNYLHRSPSDQPVAPVYVMERQPDQTNPDDPFNATTVWGGPTRFVVRPM